jgi:hypothetical protein
VRSSVKSSTPANDNLIDGTREVWQRRLPQSMSVSWLASGVLARSLRIHTRKQSADKRDSR